MVYNKIIHTETVSKVALLGSSIFEPQNLQMISLLFFPFSLINSVPATLSGGVIP